jgi:general stress protein 26
MPLEDKILKLIKGPKIAAVATVTEESKLFLPRVRYMVTTGWDDLSLTAFTAERSGKVQQIEKNPNVALTIREEGDYSNPYVIIRASADIHRDAEAKRRFWGPHLQKNVKNPQDPRYVALRFVPLLIEHYGQGQVEVWKKS